MVIPLLSEFLEYEQGACELRAFKRLATRLKTYFPRLPLLLLLDGLYANGPVMEQCRNYHWQFMTVLKDDSLSTVGEEFHSLRVISPENNHQQSSGVRRQMFKWVNDIDYYFGPNARHKIILPVVVCEAAGEEVLLSYTPSAQSSSAL